MNILKMERKKIYKRPEYWLSYFILIIPLILALGFRFQNLGLDIDYNDPGDIAILTLVSMSIGMASSFIVYHIFFAVLATNTLSSELDNQYYTMYFPKITSKSNLYTIKSLVLTEAWLLHFIVFIVFSFVCHGLISRGSTKISDVFFDEYSYFFLANIIAMGMDVLSYSHLVLVTGAFLPPSSNIMAGIGIIIMRIFLSDVPVLKYINPRYYLYMLESLTEKTNYSLVNKHLLLSLLMSLIIIIISQIIGRKYINRER